MICIIGTGKGLLISFPNYSITFNRSLELAVKYKTHIDTVLHYRAKYLAALGRIEDNKRFLEYTESVPVDWAKVKSKISMELEAEKNGRSAGVKA